MSRRIRIDDFVVDLRPTGPEPSLLNVDTLPAMLLHLPSCVVRAVEYLGRAVLVLFIDLQEDFRPPMFAKQSIKVRKVTRDFDDDHVWRSGLEEEGGEGIFAYATRDPERKLHLVFQELHVGVWRIWIHHRQIFWFIVWRGWCFLALRHLVPVPAQFKRQNSVQQHYTLRTN